MSSTNRGSIREVSDYYATPLPVVEAAMKKLGELEGLRRFTHVLDPCAGGNPENDTHYATGNPYACMAEEIFRAKVDSIDIREDSSAMYHGDFLKINAEEWARKYDLAATNPPFAIAEEVIRHSFDFVERGGFVMMLLRLNFLEGLKRKALFDEYMPKYIFVHRKRIDFTQNLKNGKHGTDSIAYAHYVWQKGYEKDNSKLFII